MIAAPASSGIAEMTPFRVLRGITKANTAMKRQTTPLPAFTVKKSSFMAPHHSIFFVRVNDREVFL